ncbi:hypothetical protein [Vreelandella sp. EE7]
MLSLSFETTSSVLRAVTAQYYRVKHTDMLPSAGTPERAGLMHALEHFFGTRTLSLPASSITLSEWANALSHAEIDYLNLFDTTSGAFCNRLQRPYRHSSTALVQEAEGLKAFLDLPTGGGRTLISWLSLQTVSGFMLGALLPQQANWKARSLFESAAALWELNAGDVIATDRARWRQLVQRLPTLPEGITALATTPLDADTHRALKEKGVAHIVELYSEPALGVIAARRAQQAPFELLAHWHPTESDDYLLRFSKGSALEEVELGGPVSWVGPRGFVLPEAECDAPALASRARSEHSLQSASAA